ncbi:diaminopimelate epimerase [Desulfococcaceae bacterium HSG9]|nr:diaminopimelate epimerase [Desulfococcaceae bacterium HSG9]
MTKLPFFKMSGSGNDFIIIDNRAQIVDETRLTQLITGACRRGMAVGADGLILIEPSDKVDFKWRFFNKDGSIAEMCGNGARCTARFAFLNQIADNKMAFETVAGIVSATVNDDLVKIKMTDPFDFKPDYTISLENETLAVSSINTGVPHVVIPVDDIETVDVVTLGRKIRYHQEFAPAGTNVNFIALQENGLAAIRTYERGVEEETLACGTGTVASALILAHTFQKRSPVKIMTRSGSCLNIYFEIIDGVFKNTCLEGDARVIYQGELWDEAWQ